MTLPLRKEQLAINLRDLDRVPADLCRKLFGGRLDLANPIVTNCDRVKGAGETVIVFTCPLMDAALICDIVRNNDRSVGDQVTRLYIKRGEAWGRITFDQVLTVIDDRTGKAKLNPAIFPTEVIPAEAIAPTPQRVLFTKGK